MKADAVKRLVYGFWEEKLEDVKPRLRGTAFLKDDLVNDTVGPKRAGKTYFMYYIAKSMEEAGRRQFIYLNCEHRSVYPLKTSDLNAIIELAHQEELLKGRLFVLLDEVQTVNGWEIFVKSLYDEFRGRIKVMVSGSTRSLLSEDYGRLLTGRHRTIKIFPLSFLEYLAFRGFGEGRLTEGREAKLKKTAEKYMRWGAFPKYVLTEDPAYLEQVFDDIIERDIKTRPEIRKKNIIDEMASLLLERSSSRISYTKLRNIIRDKGYEISTDLVIRYASIFKNVFLFFFLPAYSGKYSQMIKNPQKVYAVDNGFLTAFPMRVSENTGKLMENAVFLELIKRGFEGGKSLFYCNLRDGEVDFLIKEGPGVRQLIQTTYASGKDDIERREIKSLLKASEELRCRNLLTITWDYEAEEKIKGRKVNFVPLWKWLLGFGAPKK